MISILFGFVRSSEKMCWWEKSFPTKEDVWHKKVNSGISWKLLLKISVSFLQTSKKWTFSVDRSMPNFICSGKDRKLF